MQFTCKLHYVFAFGALMLLDKHHEEHLVYKEFQYCSTKHFARVTFWGLA